MPDINHTISAATQIPVPVDATLTHTGQAADAAAVGAELTRIEALSGNITVNGEQQDDNSDIKLEAGDIKVSGETDAKTISEVLDEHGEDIGDLQDDVEEIQGTIAQIATNTQAITTINGNVAALQTAVGNIAGIAAGTYSDYGVYAGYVDNGSKRLVFYVPGRFQGRSVSIDANSAVTVRGVAGTLRPAANSSASTITASEFNALNPSAGSVSAMGFLCVVTTTDGFFQSGSANLVGNNTPVTVYGKFNIVVS